MNEIDSNFCKSISQSLDIGIIVLDQDERIQLCNKWILDKFEKDNKSLLEQSIFEVFPEIINSRLSSAIHDAISMGLPAIVSNVFNRSPFPLYKDKNSSERIFQNINIIPFEKDSSKFVIIQISDVSASVQREKAFEKQAVERKKIELKLRETLDELEKVSKAKGEFLASMSHEIRTPMNGIMGLSQLLRKTELSSTQKNYLGTIDESVNLLLTVINDILDFSKLESGKLQLHEVDFKFNNIVNSIIDILYLNIKNKNLNVSVDIDKKLDIYYIGDDNRIKQVLLNMISNAIKFTESGDIYIKFDCIKNNDNSTLVKVSVRDTGIGIDGEAQKKLFDKFTQADSSTTRKYGGTGLGLAICKNIIELMNGSIGADSVLNEGSTFWFQIELNKSLNQIDDQTTIDSDSDSDSEPEFKAGSYTGTVLLVDDVVVNQIVAQAMLEELGFNVITADNGLEAINLFRGQNFKFILMDCQMPIMDGFEATKKIREFEGEKHTPIIALTALAMKGDDQLCFDAGMDDYMTKPYDMKTLVSTINRCI